MVPAAPALQRFAQMLLVAQDYLKKRWDLDFFSAAMFVQEVALLGNRLDEIKALGPEAGRKLDSLSSMPDDMVGATVYELLVGAAGVRKGLDLTMVPEDRSRKAPDFRIEGFGPFLGAIECKRRLGLTSYELDEAKIAEKLYSSVRPLLHERCVHGAIETSFDIPLRLVPQAEFIDAITFGVLRNCAT